MPWMAIVSYGHPDSPRQLNKDLVDLLTMKRGAVLGSLFALVAVGGASAVHLWMQSQFATADHPGWNGDKTAFRLPNGWAVSPVGRLVQLPGDMPVGIIVNPGGTKAIVSTCGFHDHSLSEVDLASGAIDQSIKFDKSWTGLAQAFNGDLLLSAGKVTGSGDLILRVRQTDQGFSKAPGLQDPQIPVNDQFISGIVTDRQGDIFALNIQTDEILKFDSDGKLLTSSKVGYRPYGLALLPNESRIAVTDWGEGAVEILDAASLVQVRKVSVGSHPCALAVGRDGRIFVTNAGDNTVSVIGDQGVQETIRTGLNMRQTVGSTPDGVALDPSERSLYVTNSGDNCVTVVDVSAPGSSRVIGMIPTDRYPSSVAVTPDGRTLLIATAKGMYGPSSLDDPTRTPFENSYGSAGKRGYKYAPTLLSGKLAIVSVPDLSALRGYTAQVLKNADHGQSNLLTNAEKRDLERNALGRIHHVIYVIRENRTYDQVLGDISKGNGDANLALFGEKVTPNGHAIANAFTLFDNLYTDGEVSQCGHQWTDAAFANDYTEKQWILSYSGKGEVESDKRMFASPGDYIWTLARKHGHSAMVYGEYVNLQEDHTDADPEIVPHLAQLGFSPEFDQIWKKGARDPEKVDLFLSDMRKAEQTGKWYDLMVMALPEDHTRGLSPGRLSPLAMVASNDQAIGKLVDGVSHSKFWADTAIFIIEDDAQDGPDHVDCHRTVGLVVSPYVKRDAVDSTHYSTSSMLRTMELILGLPPMTEYDALATPMYRAFTTKPDPTPFDSVPPQVDLNERNPTTGRLEAMSSKLDFSDIDRADPQTLNHILWEAYRPGLPYPAPVRTGFLNHE